MCVFFFAVHLQNSGEAPVPPQRISSIRNSAGSGGSLPAVPTVGSVTSSSSSHNQSHHSQSSTVIITSTSTSAAGGGGSLHRKDTSLTSVSSSSSAAATSSKMPLPEIDLEAKYAFYFHKVTEFPQPIPFLNVPKIYQSELRQQQQQQQGAAQPQPPHRQ